MFGTYSNFTPHSTYLALASASSYPLLVTSSSPPIRCLNELRTKVQQPLSTQPERYSISFFNNVIAFCFAEQFFFLMSHVLKDDQLFLLIVAEKYFLFH